MNFETEIRLQAYLDGELSPNEAREVARELDQDTNARALFLELKLTKELLSGNEPEFRVPETREFYWSKIEREILRQNQAAPVREKQGSIPWWLRIAAPVAAAMALVMVAISMNLNSEKEAEQHFVQEIESTLQDASVISFYSQSAGMTVVWLQTQ